MKVVNQDGKVMEVTERAFDVLYRDRGFKPYVPKKTTTKRTTTKKTTSNSSPQKKVNEDD